MSDIRKMVEDAAERARAHKVAMSGAGEGRFFAECSCGKSFSTKVGSYKIAQDLLDEHIQNAVVIEFEPLIQQAIVSAYRVAAQAVQTAYERNMSGENWHSRAINFIHSRTPADAHQWQGEHDREFIQKGIEAVFHHIECKVCPECPGCAIHERLKADLGQVKAATREECAQRLDALVEAWRTPVASSLPQLEIIYRTCAEELAELAAAIRSHKGQK
jgi:hypothetical protein